jgi:excisionase family DNA binding protein
LRHRRRPEHVRNDDPEARGSLRAERRPGWSRLERDKISQVTIVATSEDPAGAVLRELAGVLPGLLDDSAIRELADRLRPHLSGAPEATAADQLLTARDAAAYAKVNVETIRRALRAGEIPLAAKIGRSPRITREALDAWLADTMPVVSEPTGVQRRRRRRQQAADGSLREFWSQPA